MPNQNTGSFGAAIGGSAALKAAMQRRGIDASVLDQVSPAAAPVTEVAPANQPPVRNIEQGAATTLPPEQPGATQGVLGASKAPVRSGEMEIALKALAQTVRTENKIAESVLRLR